MLKEHGFNEVYTRGVKQLSDAFLNYGANVPVLEEAGKALTNYQTNIKYIADKTEWVWRVCLINKNGTIALLFPKQNWSLGNDASKSSVAVYRKGDINDADVETVLNRYYDTLLDQNAYGLRKDWLNEVAPANAS